MNRCFSKQRDCNELSRDGDTWELEGKLVWESMKKLVVEKDIIKLVGHFVRGTLSYLLLSLLL